jgi:glycosyltransferase involved in cell wall biosynthesis
MSSTPKVAIFSGTFREKADGVARTLFRLSATLSKNNIEHWVFAPMIDPLADDASTISSLHTHEVRSVAIPTYADYRISLPGESLTKLLDTIRPNIIHIATPDLLGKFALGYAKRRGLPVVAAYHTDFPSYLSYYHLGWLEGWLWRYLRKFYQQCDLLLAPTQAMIQRLRQHDIGADNQHGKKVELRLWGRGIEAQLFNPSRRNSELRRSWGGESNFYIVFVGRLVWYKELGLVREVYRMLQSSKSKKTVPLTRFVFIGDGPARAELQATMPEAIFCGHVEKFRVGEVLASGDLLLFPSRTETFGQVVMESLACGLPAIVSDHGGPAEIVRAAQAGRVIAAGDVAAFSQAVDEMVGNQELFHRFRQCGLEFTRGRDWHEVNQVVLQAYDELLQRSLEK